MSKAIYFVLLGCFTVTHCYGESMIAKGVWDIIAVKECEDPDQYAYRCKVEKRKVDRTHDGFNAWLELDETLDENFAIRLEICKHVDGGCKSYQTMFDESVVNFVKKFAEENMRTVLTMAGIEPADFPVAAGEYEIEKYQIDKCELPCESVKGLFDAEVYLLKGDTKLSCLIVTVEFREPEDDDEVCDKCKDD